MYNYEILVAVKPKIFNLNCDEIFNVALTAFSTISKKFFYMEGSFQKTINRREKEETVYIYKFTTEKEIKAKDKRSIETYIEYKIKILLNSMKVECISVMALMWEDFSEKTSKKLKRIGSVKKIKH